ncbi:MAG: hypothetical protein R3B13_21805 [Polyangiaceae bacterium]
MRYQGRSPSTLKTPTALVWLTLALAVAGCGGATPAPTQPSQVESAPAQAPAQIDALSTEAPTEVLAFLETLPSPAIDNALAMSLGRASWKVPSLGHPSPDAPQRRTYYLDVSPLRMKPRLQEVQTVELASLSEARAQLESMAQRREVRLEPLGELTRATFRFGPDCMLGGSEDHARLSCGPEPALSRTAPHLMQRPSRLATDTSGARLWVTVPVRILHERFGGLIARGQALLPIMAKAELDQSGDALARLLLPIVDDAAREGVALFSDLDRVELHAKEDSSAVEIETELHLRAAKGWLASAVQAAGKGLGPRGKLERLPKQAELVVVGAGLPAKQAQELEAFMAQWLRAIFGPGYRESAELMAGAMLPDVGFAYAHGDAHGRDVGFVRFDGNYIREHTQSLWGWHVIGYEQEQAHYAPLLQRGQTAYNGGELRRLVYQELTRLCRGLPDITRGPGPKPLPAGSERYAMTFNGKFFDTCAQEVSTTPVQDLSLVGIAAPEGKRTWMGFSVHEAALIPLLADAVAGKNGLGQDKSLEPLFDEHLLLGGFATLRGIASFRRNLLQTERPLSSRRNMDALPHHGKDRMLWKLSVSNGNTLRGFLRLPVAALDDLHRLGAMSTSSRRDWLGTP